MLIPKYCCNFAGDNDNKKVKRMKANVLATAFFAGLLSCTNSSAYKGEPNNDSLMADTAKPAETAVSVPSDQRPDKVVTLAFVGDVMMGTNFPSEAFVTKDRGASLFKDCKDILKSADVSIANLEGACYEGMVGQTTKNPNGANSYIFRMPGDHVHHLVDCGIDAVGCANNHSNDFGTDGRKRTLKTLDSVGIMHSGILDMTEAAVFERDGVKYAYIAFAAACRGTLDLNKYNEVRALIKKYRPQCDVLIVSFHGGAEGSRAQHVTRKHETFLGEDRGNVYEFAHMCIDEGVDIVIGHGPHVPRAVEMYKNHFIAYSLGNFCTPYKVNLAGVSGQAALLEVKLNTKDGTFAEGKIHSYLQTQGVGPRTDNNNSVAKTIRSLTNQDIPEAGLDISDSGVITIK